ncbi:hypothetical protein ACFGVR_04660 [Mucilaginibacter sp. AW1-3]
MKKYLLIACLLVLAACKKDNDVAPQGSYISANGTWISVADAQWYLTRIGNRGGEIHLKLNGSTNAGMITLRGFGDGVINDSPLPIDNKTFSTDAGISFSMSGVPPGKFVASTQLTAHRGNDVFTITLKSDSLKY